MLRIVLIVLLLASAVQAQEVVTTVTTKTGGPAKLESKVGDISIGYVKVGTKEVTTFTWHPDFKIGPWGLGADLNLSLGENKPEGYDDAVLRYLEYDDGLKGLRYGVIDNLTWGHGMLISNYSSRMSSASILQNNDHLALKGYVDFDPYVVRVLNTRSGIIGVRFEERINPMLTLGQTYITDTDGVTLAGTTEVQKVSGAGVDASVPLPLNFEGYAEYATLIDRGSGFSAGLSWAYDIMVAQASFLAEYRLLDSNFVPGYYDADYEYNPINLTSAEATGNSKNGYFAQLGVNAMGLAGLTAAYEWYNDSEFGAVNADLFATLPQEIEVTGYYKQPKFSNFRSLSLEEGAIMGGSVAYPVNPYTRVVVHYKKVYNPAAQQVEESRYYELKISL